MAGAAQCGVSVVPIRPEDGVSPSSPMAQELGNPGSS